MTDSSTDNAGEARNPTPPPPPSRQFDPLGILRRRSEDEVTAADIGAAVGDNPVLTGAGLGLRKLWRRLTRPG